MLLVQKKEATGITTDLAASPSNPTSQGCPRLQSAGFSQQASVSRPTSCDRSVIDLSLCEWVCGPEAVQRRSQVLEVVAVKMRC